MFVVFVIGNTAWAAQPPIKCRDAIEFSTVLNATQLFEAVSPCIAEKQPFEATLLLLEGQVRAMADMELLAPKTDQGKIHASNLYGRIFFSAGGAGDRELYRDPAKVAELFRRLESWAPTFSTDYDPGWQYKKRPTVTEYEASIKYGVAYRIAQLRHYAALIQNDQYYAADTEMNEIRRRNPKGIPEGSKDWHRVQELSQLMHKSTAVIARPDMPKARPYVYTPDPDADFKQVFVGFNGPERGGATVIHSKPDAEASWLATAISHDDFKKILEQVQFDSQILVLFAVGEHPAATGQVFVTDVSYNALTKSFSVSGRVGVNEEDCSFQRAKSYPFAVAIAPRPSGKPTGSGYSVGNFGDGCKQPKAGRPTTSSLQKP